MMHLIKNNYITLLNIVVLIFLVILPYLLFQGKYYISGDDTRLYYYFPYEYFYEFTFSSWHHFSSAGAFGPTQFMVPPLLMWTLLDFFIPSKIFIGYLGFSAPLILGFLFFQLMLSELLEIKDHGPERLLGSLFFIFSPIMLTNQYFIFLSTVWVLPLIPITIFLLLRYIKTGLLLYPALAVISSIILSIGFFSIPWIVGSLIPFLIALIIINLTLGFNKKKQFIARVLVFSIIVLISQSFWLLSFLMTYLGQSNVNFGSRVFTKEVADTFSPTVLATAVGNVIYPLLNLFHRQIAFDFVWHLKNTFISYYDKILFLNLVFISTVILGVSLFKKVSHKNEQKIFLIILISFLVSLYFFTVNIGILKDTFLFLGKIPGFVMFRNFYDKFAVGYVIFYSILLTYALIFIKRYVRKIGHIFSFIVLLVILVNLIPIGAIVNAPLWETKNTGRNITVPDEYLNFMKEVKKEVSSTNNIFTIPFGTSVYSVIKDVDTDSVYTGTSPVKLFSGVNDFSGALSFYYSEASNTIETIILKKEFEKLNNMLHAYNVNYAFINENIPREVLSTWVFDEGMNLSLDNNFKKDFLEQRPLIVSTEGNYKLYKFKNTNSLIKAKNISFRKINETKFNIYISSLQQPEKLFFHDSFHDGWKLYLEKNPNKNWCERDTNAINSSECREHVKLFEGDELSFLIRNSAFDHTHKPYSDYFVNEWTIDPHSIKENYSSEYYKQNSDGSIDIEMTLYFEPQGYFYIGSMISLVVLIGSAGYLGYAIIKKIKK